MRSSPSTLVRHFGGQVGHGVLETFERSGRLLLTVGRVILELGNFVLERLDRKRVLSLLLRMQRGHLSTKRLGPMAFVLAGAAGEACTKAVGVERLVAQAASFAWFKNGEI